MGHSGRTLLAPVAQLQPQWSAQSPRPISVTTHFQPVKEPGEAHDRQFLLPMGLMVMVGSHCPVLFPVTTLRELDS
jgi:hypothetical protein